MANVLGGVAKLFENISGKKFTCVCPKETAARERRARFLLNPSGASAVELSPNRVRLVVFRDDKGQKLPLFDSDTQTLCSEGDGETSKEHSTTRSLCDMRSGECIESSSSSFSGWSKPARHKLNRRPSTDSELLGEMMFGSMPLKTVGNTVKVHYIRSTDQLMLTKVFSSQRKVLAQCSLTDFSESCPLPGEMSSTVVERSMKPIPKTHSLFNTLHSRISPPDKKLRSSSLSVPQPGATRPSRSPPSPSPSPLNSSISSVNSSLSRRIQRSRSTSLENASELYRKVIKPLDQTQRKGRKYGIGVIICLSELSEPQIKHFQQFFFSHFTLIDAHLFRLQECVEEACYVKGQFQQLIARGYQMFLQDFLSLYKSQRIESPVWLSLVSHAHRRREVCMQFMEELGSAIVELDTKETKFFFSTLLTAVLSHHLAWLYTVSKQSTDTRHNKMASKSLSVLAETHPYNPLWAQLSDLFGAVSNPLKITRTIVTGRSTSTVCRLLYLLTYFIRCSEIQPGFVQDSSSFHQLSTSTTGGGEPRGLKGGSHDEPPQDGGEWSHDWEREVDSQLEESEVLGSRTSSAITLISEQDRQPFASPASVERETPVVRPHPFSFRAPHSVDSHKSDSFSDAENSPDSRSYETTLCNTASISLSRKSNSLSKSGSIDSKKGSPLLSATRPLHVPMATAGHVTYAGDACNPLCGERHNILFARSESHAKPPTSNKNVDSAFEKKPEKSFHHFPDSKTCAYAAAVQSMGFCLIPEGFVRFDPGRDYSSRDYNPRGHSPDDLSLTSDLTTSSDDTSMSRNNSTNSLTTPPTTTTNNPVNFSAGGCPSSYHRLTSPILPTTSSHSHSSAGNPLQSGGLFTAGGGGLNEKFPSGSSAPCAKSHCRVSGLCGSWDSGYNGLDQSLTASCLTESTKETENTQVSTNWKEEASSTLRRNSWKASDSTMNRFSNSTTEHSLPDFEVTTTELSPFTPTASTTNHQSKITTYRTPSFLQPSPPSMPQLTSRPRSDAFVEPKGSPQTCELLKAKLSAVQAAKYFRQTYSAGLIDQAAQNAQNEKFQLPRNISGSAENISKTSGQVPGNSQPGSVGRKSPRATNYHTAPASSRSTLLRMQGTTFASPLAFSIPPALNNNTTTSNSSSNTGARFQDSQSLISEADSGHCTKSWRTYDCLSRTDSSCSVSQLSQISESFAEDPLMGGEDSDDPRDCISDVSSPPLMDVEESLSANQLLSLRKYKKSLLENNLAAHDHMIRHGGKPMTLEHQLQDFTTVELPVIDEFHLDTPPSESSLEVSQIPMQDFGHSLFVGHSDRYLADFILHGTSQPLESFKEKLVSDLANIVKHSVIDDPVEHGVAIVADTDTWSVKIFSSSRSVQTSDVVVYSGRMNCSQYIKQLLSSIRSMWEMRMPPEFCLSHVEDRLLELSDLGALVASTVTEHCKTQPDIGKVLSKAMDNLGVAGNDRPLLTALASIHCSDPDASFVLSQNFTQTVLSS